MQNKLPNTNIKQSKKLNSASNNNDDLKKQSPTNSQEKYKQNIYFENDNENNSNLYFQQNQLPPQQTTKLDYLIQNNKKGISNVKQYTLGQDPDLAKPTTSQFIATEYNNNVNSQNNIEYRMDNSGYIQNLQVSPKLAVNYKNQYLTFDIFQETIQQINDKIDNLEKRMEATEEQVQINDKILELRSIQDHSKSPFLNNSQISNKADVNKSGGLIKRVESQNIQDQQDTFSKDKIEEIIKKVVLMEQKVKDIEEVTKLFKADIEKRINEFSQKVNQQLEKFLKTTQQVSQKISQFTDKDMEKQEIFEKYEQQIQLLNQNFIMNKEESNDIFKTINTNMQELQNNINLQKMDVQQIKPVVKNIEDDLFKILHNHKEMIEGIQETKFVHDEVSQLKSSFYELIRTLQQNGLNL